MAKITKGSFKKLLDGSVGTNRDMSIRLNVSDSAITQYLERNPDMRALLDKQRMNNIDKAEHEIFQQLEFEDSKSESSAANIRQKASQFILTRLGKTKGWMEKTEQSVEHSGEQIRLIIEEKIPDGTTKRSD